MTNRFYVLSAKIARQASERFASETGYLVFDATRVEAVYRCTRKSEANAVAERLNQAASK